MINAKPRREFYRALAAYAGAVLACLAILTMVYELWRADFKTPFRYKGDGIFGLALAKGVIETGWYLDNPSLGAPEALNLRDFPLSDSLHFLWLRAIACAAPNYAAAYNIYFLLGFPLATVTTLFVLRRFNVSYLPAIAASLLYTFQPYHYLRGLGHFCLAAYYLVPCQVMVALWIYLDRLPSFAGDQSDVGPDRKARFLRLAGSIVICILQSSAGVYYAFFTCYLFIVAGVAAALQRKRLYPLFTAALLIGVTGTGVLANISSSLFYNRAQGPNREVARRNPFEAEVFALKMTHLLFPVPGHRIGFLAQKRSVYDRHAEPSNENNHAALGAAGAIGFCVLIGLLLAPRPSADEPRLLHGLALLNVFAMLLATLGGFGMIFNTLITPQIRCYNRLSIFIAFFALFAMAILLQMFGNWFATSKIKGAVFALLMVVLLGLGLFDQTPKEVAWDYPTVQQRCASDRDLVARIEATLAPQSMIYQIPYVAFPESPPLHRMFDYDHFRGYLHSRQLRWSYGAIRGRPTAIRAQELSLKPIDEQLPELVRMGFSGIWVDRFGYEDNGADVEKSLRELLQIEPLVSSDERTAFFDMTGYAARSGGESPATSRSAVRPGIDETTATTSGIR